MRKWLPRRFSHSKQRHQKLMHDFAKFYNIRWSHKNCAWAGIWTEFLPGGGRESDLTNFQNFKCPGGSPWGNRRSFELIEWSHDYGLLLDKKFPILLCTKVYILYIGKTSVKGNVFIFALPVTQGCYRCHNTKLITVLIQFKYLI